MHIKRLKDINMAQSICPNCKGTTFEGVEKSIIGLRYRVTFIQCANCGCVVGVLNTAVLSNQITEIAKQAVQTVINNR